MKVNNSKEDFYNLYLKPSTNYKILTRGNRFHSLMSARQKRLSHCLICKAKLGTFIPRKITFFITTTIKSMQSSSLGRESLLLRKNSCLISDNSDQRLGCSLARFLRLIAGAWHMNLINTLEFS